MKVGHLSMERLFLHLQQLTWLKPKLPQQKMSSSQWGVKRPKDVHFSVFLWLLTVSLCLCSTCWWHPDTRWTLPSDNIPPSEACTCPATVDGVVGVVLVSWCQNVSSMKNRAVSLQTVIEPEHLVVDSWSRLVGIFKVHDNSSDQYWTVGHALSEV